MLVVSNTTSSEALFMKSLHGFMHIDWSESKRLGLSTPRSCCTRSTQTQPSGVSRHFTPNLEGSRVAWTQTRGHLGYPVNHNSVPASIVSDTPASPFDGSMCQSTPYDCRFPLFHTPTTRTHCYHVLSLRCMLFWISGTRDEKTILWKFA